MPCGDITERITITLDSESRVDSYTFFKKTCGGAVGIDSLILDRIGGQSIDSIVSDSELGFLRAGIDGEDVEEFLRVKHFHAIQSVLRAYLGVSSGGVGESCTIAGVDYDGGFTTIDADIDIDLMVDQIKACAHCGPG